jgi:hypothetical protein
MTYNHALRGITTMPYAYYSIPPNDFKDKHEKTAELIILY